MMTSKRKQLRGIQETCLKYFKITYDITLENKNYHYHGLNLKLLMHELSARLTSHLLIMSRPCGGGGALNVWHSNYFPGELNTSMCY